MVTLHMQVCECVSVCVRVHRLERMLSGTNKHRACTHMCMCMCVYSTCTFGVCTVSTRVHSGCTCVHGGDGPSCSECVCVFGQCVCVCVYTWLHERARAGCMHCTRFCVHKCGRV